MGEALDPFQQYTVTVTVATDGPLVMCDNTWSGTSNVWCRQE
jgi:hypothetical protein